MGQTPQMTNVQRIRLTPDQRLDERISVAKLHEAFQGVVPEDDDERVYLIITTGFGRLRGTSEDVVDAASHHRTISRRLKLRAAVVVTDDLAFGIVRMLASHVDDPDYELRPFHEEEEATSWLRECMGQALPC